MTPREFLHELKQKFPRHGLSNGQEAAFTDAVANYRLSREVVDKLWETSSRNFPTGAEISKIASKVEGDKKQYLRPHVWKPSTCTHCHGEGKVSLFGEMFYGDGSDEFQIQLVTPYHQSGDPRRRFGATLVEMLARCVCQAGDAPTLGAGIAKWRGSMAVIRNPVR